MKKQYDVIKTERAALGRFAIRLDTVSECGKEYPYSYIEMKDCVAVLAEVDKKFVLIRQYRHSLKKYILEIPGGSLHADEKPEEAASRELLEETGYKADKMYFLGSFYPSAGSSNDCCYLYYVKCNEKIEQQLEPLEYVTIELLGQRDIEQAISDGELKHSMALVAWLKYKLNKVGERDAD